MTTEPAEFDVEALPFDQYQRYRLVADLLGELRGESPLRVLDVGGRTGLLRAFLPRDRVDLLDVEASTEDGLVLGDGSALPFADGAYDAVCAFDTLEHVPPGAREAFAAECARVAGRWVFLVGPYQHPRVDEAEERLVDFLEHKLRSTHRYLSEHRDNGLPDRIATVQTLEGLGARVACFGHGDLTRWLALMCLELYLDHDPMLRPVASRFFRFYNRIMFASDHGPEVYRHAVVGAFAGAELPVGKRLDGPREAPSGATEALTSLATELLAFDRDRDALGPEFERLRGIIADLEGDLDGHKSRLSDRTDDLEGHRRTLTELRATYEATRAEGAAVRDTLEADLVEHDRALAEARAAHALALEESQADREAFARDLREHERVIETHRADLEEHRSSLAEVTDELEVLRADGLEQARSAEEQARAAVGTASELRSQIEAQVAHKQALEAQLAESNAGAQAIQAELLAARGEIECLLGEVRDRDTRIAGHQADLRDRVGNLKRAFGPKPVFEPEPDEPN